MNMKTELIIYIGDLTHNYMKVANETMPLGVAYIKTYLEKKLGSHVRCKLFRYPDKILAAIDQTPPDVIMVSNYVWNEALSLFALKYAKSINPKVLTVMGGPNFPLETKKQETWIRNQSDLDIFIIGEGEKPAFHLISAFIENGASIKQVKNIDFDSSIFIRPDGSFHKGKWNSNLQDLNEIPSPYLSGDLDEFFDGKLAPIMETIRGCPFTCSFCVQGTEYYKKLRRFSLERLGKEVEYIGKKIFTETPTMGFLCMADSNFGMFKEDVEYSKFVGQVQNKYNWPTFIDATTGKNKKDTILETVSNLNGALVMYTSVQSMNPETLKNVKRRNIKIDTMRELQQEAKRRGIKTLTETILGLPGETFENHKEGLFELIDMGIEQYSNHQFMILKGSELEQTEELDKFGIKTKFRILPRNWGQYRSQKIFEIEEIAYETGSLPFSDYLRARQFHLVMMIYYNGSYFEPLIRFLAENGVDIIDWLNQVDNLVYKDGDQEIRNLFDAFLSETKNELFESQQDCVEFYSDENNFKKLKRGELGGNLIMKYRTIANFHNWESIVKYGFNCARKILNEKGINKSLDLFLCIDNIEAFIFNWISHGQTKCEFLSKSETNLDYQIENWIKDNYVRDLSYYLDSKSKKVQFKLSKESSRIISNAFDVYGDDILGKAKLCTRVNYNDFIKEVERTPN